MKKKTIPFTFDPHWLLQTKQSLPVSNDLILGIDEAGRGPILGPMIMACVGISPEVSKILETCGVVDSKQFGAGEKAHQRRMALVPLIVELAEYTSVICVDVNEIDQYTFRGQLNRLEQEKAKQMIDCAPKANKIIADGFRLFQSLQASYPQLQAWDHGESVHVSVAAASILAKTRRDEEWKHIVSRYRKEFGLLVGPGGGYANAETKRFLRAYCAKYRQLPKEGRRSWPWDFASDLLDPNEYRDLVKQMILPMSSKKIL